MRDIFKWDRTTENFFRYISSRPHNYWPGYPEGARIEDGKHLVVYIPRKGMDNPPFKDLELIVSRMTPDQAATYPYGPAVDEPETLPVPPGDYTATIKDVRKIGPETIAVDFGKMERQTVDRLSDSQLTRYPQALKDYAHVKDWRYRVIDLERSMNSKVDVTFYNRAYGELTHRLADLEFGQGILFKAVYWILRKMRVVK